MSWKSLVTAIFVIGSAAQSFGVEGYHQMDVTFDVEVKQFQTSEPCSMQNTVWYDYEQKPNNEATATLFSGQTGVVAGIASITEFDVDHPAFIVNDTWSRRVTWAHWEEDPTIPTAYDFVMDVVYGDELWPDFSGSPDWFDEEPLWDLDSGSPWFDGVTSLTNDDTTYGYLNWKWTFAGQWQCNVEMSVIAEGAAGADVTIGFLSVGAEVNFAVGHSQSKPFTDSPVHHVTPIHEVVFDDSGWFSL